MLCVYVVLTKQKCYYLNHGNPSHTFRFTAPAEEVRFTKIKNDKAQEMSNDGMTWKRII